MPGKVVCPHGNALVCCHGDWNVCLDPVPLPVSINMCTILLLLSTAAVSYFGFSHGSYKHKIINYNCTPTVSV